VELIANSLNKCLPPPSSRLLRPVKWLNVITSRENVTGLEHELQDALYCPLCLASCTETRYSVRGAMTLGLPTPSQIKGPA